MRPGKVALLVIGALVGSLAFGLLLAGAGLGWAWSTERTDDGYFETPEVALQTDGYAIVSGSIDLGSRPGDGFPSGDLLGIRIDAQGTELQNIFLGIGPADQVDAYLAGVSHDVLERFRGDEPVLDGVAGTVTPSLPLEQTFWIATNGLDGTSPLDWEPTSGDWKLVLMNADASPGVTASVTAASALRFVPWVAVGLSLIGAVLAVAAVAMLIGAVAGQRTTPALEHVSAGAYPVQLTGRLDDDLSSWKWLVKWFLAIPHFIVLAFLMPVMVVLTFVAAVAIVFTRAYPRSIFDFNVGVLRWAWRVAFYATGVIGTDRYPPFSLDRTDYPADLHVDYPAQLSRPMVFVKWLLALPHLLIIGVLTNGVLGWRQELAEGVSVYHGTSLMGLLVLIAGAALLFTTRYPQPLFDLLMGLHRWMYRVVAYVALMTDQYPPFRLDQGGDEPAPPEPAGGGSRTGSQLEVPV